MEGARALAKLVRLLDGSFLWVAPVASCDWKNVSLLRCTSSSYSIM